MRATDGEFVASREVDAMRWLPLDAARKLLTSASDKKVLDSFVRGATRHPAPAAGPARGHRDPRPGG